MKIQILPSLLAADFGHLEDGARRAEAAGGDALHLDVMDGHFVPNLSMGPDVVRMARRAVRLSLNVHLMCSRPDRLIDAFIDAGASTIQIHIEASGDVPATLARIRGRGVRPAIVLSPPTPAERIFDVLPLVDEVLCMTVNPGYGGQAFMAAVVPKVRQVRDRARSLGRAELDVMVDGGIDAPKAALCAAAGANQFVAGTSLYRAPDMRAAVVDMRRQAEAAFVL